MSEQYQTITLTETNLNRLSSILDYLLESEADSFEEYMVEHFDNDFSIDDEAAVEIALKDDRVHHIFKTAELLARAYEDQ